jgi:hypothetical protein
MSHDPKCYDLAEAFLPSDASEFRKNELAEVIQYAIENDLTEDEKAKT